MKKARLNWFLLWFALCWCVPTSAFASPPNAASAKPSPPNDQGDAQDAAAGDPELFDWMVLPVVFYQPETSLLFSVASVFSFKNPDDPEDGRPSSGMLSLTYTLKNQFSADFEPELFLDNSLWHLRGNFHFSFFPDNFYGVGNDNPEGAAERFASFNARNQLLVERRVLGRLYVGLIAEANHFNIVDVEAGQQLASGNVLGDDGGWVIGAGPAVSYDHRDDTIYPTRGGIYELDLRVYPSWLGDYDMMRARLHLRHFLSLDESGDHVLAAQVLCDASFGDVPFIVMPSPGGSRGLRGYFDGRFRDRVMVQSQLEYRWSIGGGFGAVVFGGVGRVANQLDQLSPDGLHPAGGFGLRYALLAEQHLNVRLDVAFGGADAPMAIYLDAMEAF